jgi:hypothetical protein
MAARPVPHAEERGRHHPNEKPAADDIEDDHGRLLPPAEPGDERLMQQAT